MGPIAMPPTSLRAQDQRAVRTYHDKQHNDDHVTTMHGAAKKIRHIVIYAKQNHRKNGDSSKLKEDDQQKVLELATRTFRRPPQK
jgi:hypothetical protein